MFEEYFVPLEIAMALKEAGFNEPCMAVREYYEYNFNKNKNLYIGYTNYPISRSVYNETIQEQMTRQPGLFEPKLKNTELSPWFYAAPLYDQITGWLLDLGYRLHELYIPADFKLDHKPTWQVQLHDLQCNLLWPEQILNLTWTYEQFHEQRKKHTFTIRRHAWDHTILAAIKHLKNENNL